MVRCSTASALTRRRDHKLTGGLCNGPPIDSGFPQLNIVQVRTNDHPQVYRTTSRSPITRNRPWWNGGKQDMCIQVDTSIR